MTYLFGDCELDTALRELRTSGSIRAIEPQVFDLLLYLIENRGRMVSKEEINQQIWKGRVVSDASLSTCVKLARRAIGDSGKKQSLIRTVPRLGFRFVGSIKVEGAAVKTDYSSAGTGHYATRPMLPDKPSVAVLPFTNMSGDPVQEHLSDGVAEDIITALGRYRWLLVIARGSTFTYKHKELDVRQVAAELGVHYIVAGSLRKMDDRIRITAQLIDGTNGHQLWAEQFGVCVDDIIELQDQITEQIVVAIEPELSGVERKRARRTPIKRFDAWQHYQRGLSYFYRFTKEDHREAAKLFTRARQLDPDFAPAFAYLAYVGCVSVVLGMTDDREKTIADAYALARKAVSLDRNDAVGHFALGRVLTFLNDPDGAISECETAVRLNPNFERAHSGLGYALYAGKGYVEEALVHFDTAIRLSPRDPLGWANLMLKGEALYFLCRYVDAINCCRDACRYPDTGYLPFMRLSAALAKNGDRKEAFAAIGKAKSLNPRLSLEFVRQRFSHMAPNLLEKLLDGLRLGGLPD